MIRADIIHEVDEWLDREVADPYKDQPLAQDWARVAKVIEEIGEAVSELILFTGQNPRKGTNPEAYERLLLELADAALTPVYAIQHFTKDIEETTDIMRRAQLKHYERSQKNVSDTSNV